MSSYVYCLYRVEAYSIQTRDSLSSICRDSIPEMLARHLRIWNAAFAVLHAGQGAAIVLLANDFAILVTVRFLEGPPGRGSRKPPSFPHLTFHTKRSGVWSVVLVSGGARLRVTSPGSEAPTSNGAFSALTHAWGRAFSRAWVAMRRHVLAGVLRLNSMHCEIQTAPLPSAAFKALGQRRLNSRSDAM